MKTFPELVVVELQRARGLHEPQTSVYGSVGVIEEEFLEFRAAAFWSQGDLRKEKVLAELVHLAAMCQRAAEDLGLGVTNGA